MKVLLFCNLLCVIYAVMLKDLFDIAKVVGYIFEDYEESGTWTEDEHGFVAGSTDPRSKFIGKSRDDKTFIGFFGKYGDDKYWYSEQKAEEAVVLYAKEIVSTYSSTDTVDSLGDELKKTVKHIVSSTELKVITTAPTTKCFVGSEEVSDSSTIIANEKSGNENVYCSIEHEGLTLRTVNMKLSETRKHTAIINKGALVVANEDTMPFRPGSIYYKNGKRLTNKKVENCIVQTISDNKFEVWTVLIADNEDFYTPDTTAEQKHVSADDELEFVFPDPNDDSNDNFKMEEWFPKPVLEWKSEETSDTSSNTFGLSPSKYKSDQYTFSHVINLDNDGIWTSSLYDGTTSYPNTSIYNVHIEVANTVNLMYPNASRWYDAYDTGKLAVFSDDMVSFSCDILKRVNDAVWWNIDGNFYKYEDGNFKTFPEDDDGTEVLTSTMYTRTPVQDSAQDKYHFVDKLSATVTPGGSKSTFNVICFLIRYEDGKSDEDITDKAALENYYNARNTKESRVSYGMVEVGVYNRVIRPIIKGPLSVIQEERETITMNCYHEAIPPAFVSYVRVSRDGSSTNITHEKLYGDNGAMTRYKITKETVNKTTLEIFNVEKDDMGNYTCYAINRAVKEKEAGPHAQLIIEERCVDGAKFCFNPSLAPVLHAGALLLNMAIVYQ